MTAYGIYDAKTDWREVGIKSSSLDGSRIIVGSFIRRMVLEDGEGPPGPPWAETKNTIILSEENLAHSDILCKVAGFPGKQAFIDLEVSSSARI